MGHGSLSYYYKKKCRCEPCRASSRNYRRQYRKNRPDVRAKEKAYTSLYMKKIKEFVRSQKEGKSCMDCGVVYPYFVLQYDHRGDDVKRFVIAAAGSIASAKKEIAKCDLVCGNCHAIRTHNRRLTLTIP